MAQRGSIYYMVIFLHRHVIFIVIACQFGSPSENGSLIGDFTDNSININIFFSEKKLPSLTSYKLGASRWHPHVSPQWLYYLLSRVLIVKWLVCQFLDEVSVVVMCKLVLNNGSFKRFTKGKWMLFCWVASMIGHTLTIIDWFMCNT